MEITVHANEMELLCRRDGNGVTISRVRTAGRDLVVPESIDDLPVTAIGAKAFAPHSDPDAPDHRLIRSITLPDTLEQVGDYAFYNCSGLEKLCLSGRTRYWGASCLMNCRRLSRFELTVVDEVSPALWYFADELMTELDVTLHYEDGGTARLIFPEYTESYEEKPSVFFDFRLNGAGLPYHHAFQQKRLDYGLFDGCWEEFLRREFEPDCALRLAFFRLFYPRGLSPRAGERYREYLAGQTGETLEWLMEERDSRGIEWFLKEFAVGQEVLRGALELARESRQTEATALLLERQHAAMPRGRTKTFDL